RHKGPVLAASLVVLALVGGIIGTTWGLIRATGAEADAVNEANQKAEALTAKETALADAKDKLFQALVSQARAARGSGRIGQRFETLKAIHQAARIRVTPELRTEATAALVLPDAEIAYEWEGYPEDSARLDFDATLQRYARMDKQGGVTVCRLVVGRISNPSSPADGLEIRSYEPSDCREEVITRLPAHGKPPLGRLWMSPDGRFVAYGHSHMGNGVAGGVRVWKLDGPEPAVLLDEPADMHEVALAFDPSGRRMAIGH